MPQQDLHCDDVCLHQDKIQHAKELQLDEATIERSVRFFKAFADKTRMRIITLLKDGELCVCDIAYILGVEQTAISHQLKVLRDLYIVRSRREGKSIFYSLDDDHVFAVIAQSIAHMEHC